MKIKNEIKFDEIHIKCVENLPMILDVLSDTGKKIENVFKPYSIEINEIFNHKIKSIKGWEMNKGRNANFNCFNIGIRNENTCDIRNQYLEITNKKDKRKISATFGFFYEYEGHLKYPFFYFGIYPSEKWSMNNLLYYNEIIIQNNNNKISFFIYHKDDDTTKTTEGMDILCSEPNISLIDEMYNFYKDKILIPFLNKLK